MTSFTLRPAQFPEDYPRIADVLNSFIAEPVSAETLAEQDARIPRKHTLVKDAAGRLIGHCREQVVGVDAAGNVMGWAVAWRAPWTDPGRMWIDVAVDPAVRRQGLGSQLYTWAEGYALEQGAHWLWDYVRDHLAESVAFLERRCFETDGHIFESTLDLPTFDEAPYAGVVDQVRAGGVRFFSLADEPGEATERQIYEVHKQSHFDIPAAEEGFPWFEEWRKWNVGDPRVHPDCVLIAAEGDKVVGSAWLTEIEGTKAMYNQYTGVLREYRGRRIALALKLLSIEVSRRYGAPYVRTNNHSKNGPMLAINRKLGYVPAPGVFEMKKNLQ